MSRRVSRKLACIAYVSLAVLMEMHDDVVILGMVLENARPVACLYVASNFVMNLDLDLGPLIGARLGLMITLGPGIVIGLDLFFQ